MNSNEHEELEHLMRRFRPVEASAGLKHRVFTAAKTAWNEPPAESASWWIAVWRLAGSGAAAVLVILSAGWGSDWALSRWQPEPGHVYVQVQPASGDLHQNDDRAWPRLARINVILPPEVTLDQLLRYRQSMQRLFEEESDRPPVRQEGQRQGQTDPMVPPARTMS